MGPRFHEPPDRHLVGNGFERSSDLSRSLHGHEPAHVWRGGWDLPGSGGNRPSLCRRNGGSVEPSQGSRCVGVWALGGLPAAATSRRQRMGVHCSNHFGGPDWQGHTHSAARCPYRQSQQIIRSCHRIWRPSLARRRRRNARAGDRFRPAGIAPEQVRCSFRCQFRVCHCWTRGDPAFCSRDKPERETSPRDSCLYTGRSEAPRGAHDFADRSAAATFLGLATISDSFVFLILQKQMGIP